jgi:hypothetical protein
LCTLSSIHFHRPTVHLHRITIQTATPFQIYAQTAPGQTYPSITPQSPSSRCLVVGTTKSPIDTHTHTRRRGLGPSAKSGPALHILKGQRSSQTVAAISAGVSPLHSRCNTSTTVEKQQLIDFSQRRSPVDDRPEREAASPSSDECVVCVPEKAARSSTRRVQRKSRERTITQPKGTTALSG